MLNGVTQIALTKIDVLNVFATIRVATQYKYRGSTSDQLPYDLNEVPVEPVYEDHAGWQSDLSRATELDQLPDAARAYVQKLEAYLGVPITMVSTGPERKSLILRG